MERETLASLKGIGPWTTAMVAMRGQGNPDVFPLGDLVLLRAYEALSERFSIKLSDLTQTIENWRPWRSYAANLLWRSLST